MTFLLFFPFIYTDKQSERRVAGGGGGKNRVCIPLGLNITHETIMIRHAYIICTVQSEEHIEAIRESVSFCATVCRFCVHGVRVFSRKLKSLSLVKKKNHFPCLLLRILAFTAVLSVYFLRQEIH